MRPVFLPLPALLLAIVTLTLHAQSAPADEHARAAIAIAHAESDTLIRRDFRIAPQPLPDAIREFTRQAGVQVRTEAEIPAVHSPGVVGRFTAQEALRRLIAGTGLTAEVVDDRTLALRATIRRLRARSGRGGRASCGRHQRDLDGHQYPHAAA